MFGPSVDERNLTSDLMHPFHQHDKVLLGVVRVEEGLAYGLDLPPELAQDDLGLTGEWNLLGLEATVDCDFVFVGFVDTAILSDEALQFLVDVAELE